MIKKLLSEKWDFLCRVFLGLFLLRFFILAFLVGDGLLATDALSWQYRRLGPMAQFHEEIFHGALFTGVLFALLFVAGYFVRLSSIMLLLALITILNTCMAIWEFHYTFIAAILIAYAIFTAQPFLTNKALSPHHPFVDVIWKDWLAIVFGLAFTTSGVGKLFSPYWQDGSALVHLCNTQKIWFFWTLFDCKHYPWQAVLFYWLTWVALFLELISVVLALFRPTRILFFISGILLQIGIAIMIDIPYLNLGMSIALFAIFRRRWLDDFINFAPWRRSGFA